MKKGLENIVEILDNLILNNDITEENIKYLRNYIKSGTSNLYGIDVDGIVSDFLIYAKENYDKVEDNIGKKCQWVKQSIFGLIQNEMKDKEEYFDDYEDIYAVEDNDVHNMKANVNMMFLDNLLKNSLSDLEFDIYRSCLLGGETQRTVAERRNVSDEWISKKMQIVKEKIKKSLDF